MQIQLGSTTRKAQINSIKHAKTVAGYTGHNHFLVFDQGRIIGFSRPGFGKNWKQEEL